MSHIDGSAELCCILYLLNLQIGLLDEEINTLTKILFAAVILLSFALIIMKVSWCTFLLNF